jgi:cell division protein FtsI (penicillin-binding protein 3)
MCLFAVCILYRICVIQFVEGEKWRGMAAALTTSLEDMEANRGNIFDANGALLATSLPYFEVAVDINAKGISEKFYKANRDSLTFLLSRLFKDKTPKEYLKMLNKARRDNDQFLLLKRNVSYKELQTLKTFPLFRKGRRGGLITLQTNRRERPFQMLAGRTIGMSRPGIKPVGLEGAFDSTLKGVSGKRLMQKIAGNVWRPINDENELEPKDGNDLYTTIDINLQDVATHALLKTLVKNGASYGCAVLMEVKTGEVKAIANLSRSDSTNYTESFNYAVGYATEPGSTFKLVSLLAVIDDYGVSLNEKINVGKGECTYFDKTVRDAHAPETPILTLQRVFETSSNVGVSKIITKYYAKNPQQFVDKVNSFNLGKPLGLSIPGEGVPLIKNIKSAGWSGVTLPQMSYGYETLITPLQILTLYNAVANDGRMVKPRFEREIKRNGVTIKKFETVVMSEHIVKHETIVKAKKMLEGVVANGSGKTLNITAFKVGGKTGTAAIAKAGAHKGIGRTAYGDVGDRIYQASFVGYFPADNPLYTCIVVINSPSNGVYYGAAVAGPVFKEIAEKVYSSSLNCIAPINDNQTLITKIPTTNTIRSNELATLNKAFAMPGTALNTEKYVSRINKDSTHTKVQEHNIEAQLKKGLMPNLFGLTAKDALYLLENNGFNVKLNGFGSVKKQSVEPGQKFTKGIKIVLTLS